MKLTNLTKKLLCGGIVCCSLETSTIASAAKVTCTCGKLLKYQVN